LAKSPKDKMAQNRLVIGAFTKKVRIEGLEGIGFSWRRFL
jgi:hypothetical protein